MTEFPYYVTYMEGNPIHCPKCQDGKGGFTYKNDARIIKERIDTLHERLTVDKCGHTFIFHSEWIE